MFSLLLLACSTPSSSLDTYTPEETDVRDTGTRDPIRDLDPSAFPSAQEACREAEVFRVKEVLDGDTLRVEGKWGGETVRLIGINAAEMDWNGGSHDCWAEEARTALEDLLLNEWVWLLFDKECEDPFDRTLAYAHRGPAIEDFVQRYLLRNGHAESFRVQPNVWFETLFSADESYAKREEVGLWNACNE